jgi:tetratricopeptide (TPR) repeat protein
MLSAWSMRRMQDNQIFSKTDKGNMENWRTQHGKVQLRSGEQPTTADANVAFAALIIAFRAGHLSDAHDGALALVKVHPDFTKAWHLLAQIARARGDAPAAIIFLRKAIETAPDDYALHNDLGLALQLRGQFARALGALQRSRVLAPNEVAPVLNCANVHARLGQTDAAIASYRAALRLHPKHVPTLSSLAALLEAVGRLQAASDAVKLGLSVDAKAPALQLVAARLERRAGHYEKAMRRLLVHLHAELPAAQQVAMYREIGFIHDATEDYDDAIKAFKRANRVAARITRQITSSATVTAKFTAATAAIAARCGNTALGRQDADRIPAPVFVVGFPGAGAHRLGAMLRACGVLNVGIERDVWQRIRELKARAEADSERPLEAVLKDLRSYYHERSQGSDTGPFVEVATLGLADLDLWLELFPDARMVRVLRDPNDTVLSALVQFHANSDASGLLLHPSDALKLYVQMRELWDVAIASLNLEILMVRYADLLSIDNGVLTEVALFICDDLLPPPTQIDPRLDDETMFAPGHARHYKSWLQA